MPESEGRAAVGGPARPVHDHRMVGVDVSLLPPEDFPGYQAMRQATAELLRSSMEWSVQWDGAQRRLGFRIENLAGHALPSGATADREMWIALSVRDGDGELAFESGALDARGDLKQDNPQHTLEPGADPQLVVYRQRMLFDPSLEDVTDTGPVREVDFLWQPNTFEEHLIAAGGSSSPDYDLSALAPGSYEVVARLLFRSFPPHLLRKLVDAGLLDPDVPARVPTVEMGQLTLSIDVSP